VQENLFLRQPYVELGKGLLESEFSHLQKDEANRPGTIAERIKTIRTKAHRGELQSNLPGFPSQIPNRDSLGATLEKAMTFARSEKRKVVPVLYVEGAGFIELRDALIRFGVEWVMQGTGDQHISIQQVLAQPRHYFPILISFIPETIPAGLPAIGFAKGYLHNIPSVIVRDTFAEKTYQALTDMEKGRGKEGGAGLFWRFTDHPTTRAWIKEAWSLLA